MLLIDRALLFYLTKFLKEKTIETMLKMLKNFMAKAKRLTRQKLIRVRIK